MNLNTKTHLTGYFFFLMICLFFGCKKKEEKNNDPNVQEINVDLSIYEEILTTQLDSNLFGNTQFIKLEQPSEPAFGRIDMLKYHDGRLYILDARLKSLVVFDLTGKYLGKIGGLGKGRGEYLYISDFDVGSDGRIYAIDGRTDNLHIYDSSWGWEETMKLPYEVDMIKCLTNDKIMLGLSAWNEGEEYNRQIVIVDEKLELVDSYLDFDEYIDNSYWISYSRFCQIKDRIFYNKTISNKVYEFSMNGRLLKKYVFDFGTKNVPDRDKLEIESKLDKYENYRMLSEFVGLSSNLIYGQFYDRNRQRTFYADIGSKKLFLSEVDSPYKLIDIIDDKLIRYIYPWGHQNDRAYLPEDIKEHLSKDKYVVCINSLNLDKEL